MDKYPEFDKRERFGPSIEGAVPSGRIARTPEDRILAEGDSGAPAQATQCDRHQRGGAPREI
jgi:hypothetical protein